MQRAEPTESRPPYRFRRYALDEPVALDAGATKGDLLTAIERHVVDKAKLEGTYAP